jgi:2-dehydro-3-deoxyphosphogluconate aldolase / (4S)-4-hydroxy-2-oxoglutarate aldolase
MSHSEAVYNRIAELGIVAGMRGPFGPDVALEVTGALLEAELNVFEFTMNSEQPLEAMQAVKAEHGDAVFAGMGTVLSVAEAQRVIDAGADFIVSPAFQPEVVQTVLEAGLLIAPGVTTPSEAVAAWGMGVPLLKLFPVGALGVDYFKAMYGPLSHMKFMCNGAMNQENARAFIQAGAVAVGMGSWLTGTGSSPLESIRARATTLKTTVTRAKTNDITTHV